MKFQKGIIFFLMLVCTNVINSLAVETSHESYWDTFTRDVSSGLNDFYVIAQEFGDIGLKDLHYGTQLLALDALIMNNDEGIRRLALNNHSKDANNFFEITNNFGDRYAVFSLAPVLYLGGLFTGFEAMRVTGRQTAEALILSGFFVQIIKMTAGRSRPYSNKGNSSYDPFTQQESNFSFPSGHSAASFAMAAVLAGNIDRWWASTILYGMAASTGLARIYFDKHWSSDVFMGAAIGIISAKLIMNAGKISDKLNIGLAPFSDGVGIYVTCRF